MKANKKESKVREVHVPGFGISIQKWSVAKGKWIHMGWKK